MKTLKLYGFFFLLLFTCVACEETCCDNPEETADFTPPESGNFEKLRNLACDLLLQTHTFDAANGTTFTSRNGVVIQLFPQCFTGANGIPLAGEIILQFIEIYNREDMLLCNKTSMGIDQFGDKQMLSTGGIFYLEFLHKGTPVDYNCEMLIQVPISLTGDIQESLSVWAGSLESNNTLAWNFSANGSVFLEEDYYILNIFQTKGWLTIAKLYDTAQPTTTLRALVSKGYQFDNAAIYIAYQGELHGLAHMDAFSSEEHLFFEVYQKLPLGQEVHVVFVSEDAGSWRYAIKTILLQENEMMTFLHHETQILSLEGIKEIISDLP